VRNRSRVTYGVPDWAHLPYIVLLSCSIDNAPPQKTVQREMCLFRCFRHNQSSKKLVLKSHSSFWKHS